MKALGRHILAEFVNCQSEILNDVSGIEKSMLEAAKAAGATVISSNFHHFSPFGVSGVVVIQESHLAIHTWPEYQYAAVDVFTCGETVDPWISFEFLKKVFGAEYTAQEIQRGLPDKIQKSTSYRPPLREERIGIQGPPQVLRNVWFTDKSDTLALSLRYDGEVLYNKTTVYQQVRVLNTLAYGKLLAINNMIMCTERDEAHYHEMMVHPAMQLHKKVKNVLVIGGGDGGSVRELVKYKSIEKITLVEIDEAVIEASKLHLPALAKDLTHPKVQIIIADGIDFIKKAKPKSFDLVIVDGSDPVGPAEGLFTEDFYKDIKSALSDDGILMTQGESPMFHESTFVALNQSLKSIFGQDKVHTLLFHATTYPSGMWSLMMATKSTLNPKKDINTNDIQAFVKTNKLRYYNDELHVSSFSLPNFVQDMLKNR